LSFEFVSDFVLRISDFFPLSQPPTSSSPMSDSSVRFCPHCRRLTHNAVTSPPVYDARLGDGPADDAPRVTRLRRYCANCGEMWESVEAPLAVLDELLQLQTRLEDAKRQLAMLRLLLACDRREAEETPQTIPLRRAA
jgi:hypothetical protein